MILAWHTPAPQSLPCYSFGGMFRDSQDVMLSRKVAAACQQSLQLIPVGSEFLSQFARYAERTVYLSDGCVDVSHSPDLFVNERARQIAPVRLTGNYGGEVLRRVRAFKPVMPVTDLFCPEVLSQIQAAQATYDAQIHIHPLSFAVFRQAPWHHYGLRALEQTQLSVRSPYLDNNFVRTVFRAPDSACRNNDICLRLIGEGNPDLLEDQDRSRLRRQFRPLGDGDFARVSRVYRQGGIRLRLRNAPVCGARRSPAQTSTHRTTLPRAAQVLPFSRVVPGCVVELLAGCIVGLKNSVAPVLGSPPSRRNRGWPSQGGSQLYNRDS